ncbi:MAG TPA: sugar ABC transporter substrate-binding protein [Lachnospiraceae bacterium]|nr:sugar ABC transporter substrate-binding protein [Lachnospiraceae bacterium]
MKKLTKLLSVALAATMTLSLVGCGGVGKDTNEKTKIRFATWDNADSLVFQQEMVDKFNEKSDKVEVVLESYGDNYDTKITAGMGSKDAPDVMYMWNYPKYSEGLLPLDDLINAEGTAFKDNFYETLWNYNSIDGVTLGMPVGYTTHVLYYNKDLFDAAGVEYPTDTWTWGDVRAAAEKIADPVNKTYGIAFPIAPDPYDYEMFAWTNGGAYVDAEGNAAGELDSDKTAEPFQLFQDMLKSNIAIGTEDYGEESFQMGKAGMFINGSWPITNIKDAGVNFGVELLPRFDEATPAISILSSSGVAISKTTANQEAAWEFVKYWTSEELNKARIGYELPVLKTIAESEKMTTDEVYAKFYKMLEQSSEYMPASFVSKDWLSLSEKINLALEEILNKNSFRNAKEALGEATK